MGEIDATTVSSFFSQIASKMACAELGEIDASTVSTFFILAAFKIEISASARKELDQYLATGLNIVRDYVRPGENRLSDILRDLLDPRGPHGQGSLFLEAFLREVGASGMVVDEDSGTIREHYTDAGRRIDLVLTFACQKAICIENKPPSAPDQKNQIKDYADYLQRKFPNGYVLCYLTSFGHPPSAYSIGEEERKELKAAGKLIFISYEREITNWLEACFKECKAEKVRWLLADFDDFINEQLKVWGEESDDAT